MGVIDSERWETLIEFPCSDGLFLENNNREAAQIFLTVVLG